MLNPVLWDDLVITHHAQIFVFKQMTMIHIDPWKICKVFGSKDFLGIDLILRSIASRRARYLHLSTRADILALGAGDIRGV